MTAKKKSINFMGRKISFLFPTLRLNGINDHYSKTWYLGSTTIKKKISNKLVLR